MRRKTKGRKYTELRGREGVGEVLDFYDVLIQEALEKIKIMY